MEPRHKGVGLIAVVQGIKANPAACARVPPALRHYLEQRLLPSAWYAESDYTTLIEILADVVRERLGGRDVWMHFGRVAAQRDIAGAQHGVPEPSRTAASGIYRNFLGEQRGDPLCMFQRVAKLWRLYHDTGEVTCTRASPDGTKVIIRLDGHRFGLRGLVELQAAYLIEFAGLMDVTVHDHVARWAPGQDWAEWHYTIDACGEALTGLRALPLLERAAG